MLTAAETGYQPRAVPLVQSNSHLESARLQMSERMRATLRAKVSTTDADNIKKGI